MEKITLYLIIVVSLIIVYGFYQFIRNEKVYKIKTQWLDKDDLRNEKYSYDFMFNPSKKNWYGLKYPREKQFKK